MELKFRGAVNGSTGSRSNDADDVTDPRAMFKEIHKKALSMNIPQDKLSRLQFTKNLRQTKSRSPLRKLRKLCLALVAAVAVCAISWHLDWPVSRRHIVHMIMLAQGQDLAQATWRHCLIKTSSSIAISFRPILECDFCRNMSQIDRLPHISPSEFEDKYAYSGRPVVISDGAANWSSIGVFSFEFFRDLYEPESPVLKSKCHFFRYQFDQFHTMKDVFSAYESSEHFKNGSNPVYIGWENCDAAAGRVLRSYYSQPYFLPPLAESLSSDWIFMGSPGYGANMHIDSVKFPSWQAQISGHKHWTLESPYECLLECPSSLTVTVHPGEIIALDTNKWFHSTLIVGNDISITIGSEYD